MIRYKFLFAVAILLLVVALAACGGSANSSSAGNGQGRVITKTGSPEVSANPTRTPAPAGSTTPQSVTPQPQPTSANAPLVILTPTMVPGGSDKSVLITLPDRTLAIENVFNQSGSQPNTANVGLVMTLTNTGTKTIQNASTFYQLVGSEGDTFGVEVSATPSFFGMLGPHSARSGTIVFAVPSAESSGLRLLFTCEIASEKAISAI
jgi:hypothetical protein